MGKVQQDTIRATEQSSKYRHLEKMSVMELLGNINKEDSTVSDAVKKALPQIEKVVRAITESLKKGGRLFYVGAGTAEGWEFWMQLSVHPHLE